jgi:hypothetical protein
MGMGATIQFTVFCLPFHMLKCNVPYRCETLFHHVKGRTDFIVSSEEVAQKIIWTEDRGNMRDDEKTA